MDERRVFGIKLRPSAIKLLDEVEKLYERTLREEEITTLSPDTQGFANTSSDGTPIVAINPLSGRNEDNIVHELFHLKMQAEGFPLFEFEATPEVMNKNKEYLNKMRVLIYDPMTHRCFFPQMKEMGLDPNSHILAQYKQNRKSNYLPSEVFLATYYYKLALELTDPMMLEDVANWYQEKQWSKALEKGKGMLKVIEDQNPRTPDEMTKAFVACANLLQGGKVAFELRRIEERKYGSTIKRYAIIGVTETN
jgi:hypothetical protein